VGREGILAAADHLELHATPAEREPAPLIAGAFGHHVAIPGAGSPLVLSCRAPAGIAGFSRTTVSNVESGFRRRTASPGHSAHPGAAASPWEALPAFDGADPDQAALGAFQRFRNPRPPRRPATVSTWQ
jgi:hypothetical protein